MRKKVLILMCTIINLISCGREDLTDDRMSIGVFGGSVSSSSNTVIAFARWEQEFNVKVTSNGVGGAGFSSLTGIDNICNQIARAQSFDVYVLWASTNDVIKASVGDTNSYDDDTQSGGIRKSIKLIKEKNNRAQIIFLTSLPRFDEYFPILQSFIEGQKAICKELNIPYIEQGINMNFNEKNYKNYYIDYVHLNDRGYAILAEMQIEKLKYYLPAK